MEDTPMMCADDLPTIMIFFGDDPKSRSVNICSSNWISTQTVYFCWFNSQSSALYSESYETNRVVDVLPHRLYTSQTAA